MEMSSNHVMESSLDVSDDTKPPPPPPSQQQQPASQLPSSDSLPTITDATQTAAVAVTPSSASRRDGISSRAEYMTSPTAAPVANGLVR